jgi:hypothetical protein
VKNKTVSLSRRDLFSGALEAGAALSLCSALPAPAAQPYSAIVIHVAAPAGPPPLGAPVETSIPYARGRLTHTDGLAIHSPEGKPVLAQFR